MERDTIHCTSIMFPVLDDRTGRYEIYYNMSRYVVRSTTYAIQQLNRIQQFNTDSTSFDT